MENHQVSPFDHSPQPFSDVRFLLLGFDPINKSEALRKLISGGGVDAGQYGPNCTHVIVDKLSYDDPICVAARRDGKILVSSLWIDHSFDVGFPVDTTSIMYRPMRDLNGIPGAKSLVVCLTGYQREDREDIMIMVDLMGARFSKPLIANKVTHLICYKFEGEKYLLAKKMRNIKLINHLWLEDCLKAWQIVPEANYCKSGYELEMEAEAKDSEEEAEGVATRHQMASPHHSLMIKQETSRGLLNTSASKGSVTMKNTSDLFEANVGGSAARTNSVTASKLVNKSPMNEAIKGTSASYSKTESPHHSLMIKQEASRSLSNTSASKGSVTMRNTPDQFLNLHENVIGVTHEPSNLSEANVGGSAARNDSVSASKLGNKTPLNEAIKGISARKMVKTASPTIGTESNTSSAKRPSSVNLSDAFNASSYLVEKVNDGSEAALTFSPEKEKNDSFSGKRKMEVSGGSSKLQRMSHYKETPNQESVHVESAFRELKKDVSPGTHIPYLSNKTDASPAQNSPSSITGRKSLTSKGKSVISDVDIPKTFTSKTLQDEEMEVMHKPMKEYSVGMVSGGQKLKKVMQTLEKSSPCAVSSEVDKFSTPSLEINEESGRTNSKSVKRKSIGKKILAVKQNSSKKKSSSRKGSIYSKNSEPMNEATTCVVDDDNLFNNQKVDEVPLMAKSDTEIVMEVNNDDLQNKSSSFMDDETEPPEEDAEPKTNVFDIVMEEKAQDGEINDKDKDNVIEHENVLSVKDKAEVAKTDDSKKLATVKTLKEKKEKKVSLTKKGKKKSAVSVKDDVSDKKATKKKEVAVEDNNYEKLETSKEVTPLRSGKVRKNVNVLEKSMEAKTSEGENNDSEPKKNDKKKDDATENVNLAVNEKATKNNNKRPLSKTNKKNADAAALSVKEVITTDKKTVNKKKGKAVKACDLEAQKENMQIPVDDDKSTSNNNNKKGVVKSDKLDSNTVTGRVSKDEAKWFILSGHKLQKREFQQIIRRLKGKVCRVSHQWSYQATHFIVPDPVKRTEKFFAAAASGRWIMKTDYLSASNEAGRFLEEEPYEWYKKGLSEDGQINMEAPRKWRLLKEKTGHGAFYGMRIVIYGECIAPTLDTLKRVIKAGDGTILATSPPYTRFLNTNIDFAIVSPGMPHVDIWVQEFIRHEIPCVSADYLVEYVCKPGYPLEKHVQYDTNVWAERSYNNLKNRLNEKTTEPTTPESNDVACEACGSRDRGEEMLICGDESGSVGCGVGMHFDCCDPPFDDVPQEDWFCPKCTKPKPNNSNKKSSKKKGPPSKSK